MEIAALGEAEIKALLDHGGQLVMPELVMHPSPFYSGGPTCGKVGRLGSALP
jgi:hypothetical protein